MQGSGWTDTSGLAQMFQRLNLCGKGISGSRKYEGLGSAGLNINVRFRPEADAKGFMGGGYGWRIG